MFINSIRWRMQLWLAFLLVVILSGFGFTAFQLHRVNRFREIDAELERRVVALAGDVSGRPRQNSPPKRLPEDDDIFRDLFDDPPKRSPKEDGSAHNMPPPKPPERRKKSDGPMERGGFREIRLSSQSVALFDELDSNSFYFHIWSRDGTSLKNTTNAPAGVFMPSRTDASASIRTRTRDELREAYHFTELGECVLVGRNIADDMRAMNRFAWRLCGTGAVILALGLGGGWLLTNRTIRPINEISSAANRISEGNLSERISIADTDNELERLASVLNSTFARLDAAFTRQKQFTADASHELRTPLAVLISEAQTTLARDRSAEEYRETLKDCLDTAQQMRRLTESLLELARSDAGQEQLPRELFDLTAATEACVAKLRPLAADRGIQIQLETVPAQAYGLVDRYTQVITNLLSNAVQYNKPNGEVRLRVRSENGQTIVSVADTGIGIAAEDLPHIFERFYRADKSRSRMNGRFGLGLAICQAIVAADHGTITVQSVVGQGSEFIVTLPQSKT
jgi:two-component system OmpR family sensor kinase